MRFSRGVFIRLYFGFYIEDPHILVKDPMQNTCHLPGHPMEAYRLANREASGQGASRQYVSGQSGSGQGQKIWAKNMITYDCLGLCLHMRLNSRSSGRKTF